MAKQRSTERLRMLDDWLNGPVTQRIRTASDNSTSGNVEDGDQEPLLSPNNSQEPCMIVISSFDDGELMMKLKVIIVQLKLIVPKASRYLH